MKYIRESTIEEIKELEIEINENLYHKKYLHYQPTNYSNVRNLTKNNYSLYFKWFSVLDDGKNVVGMIQLSRPEYKDRVVFAVLIYKRSQGKGYGLRAMKEFFKFCKGIGIKSVEGFTTNKRLEKFYLNKLRMRKVGVFKKRRKLLNGKIYDELIFEKIL